MRLNLFALLFLIGCRTAVAQSADTIARIDKIFSSWNNATAGGSILVARGANILYHKAYGMADLERNVPNTTETIFEAGSVSKQFTAMSILLLEGEGKLSRSDDVRKYVPELPVYEAPITIQHLLNHTSGLKDWGSVAAISGWSRERRGHSLEMALEIMCRQKTLNFKPGDEYSYSNSNFSLLVVIVERVSKQPLEEFTKERLFKPLGMTNTRWRSNYREIIPRRAQAYGEVKGKTEIIMPIENIYGHGGLLTTTGDLLKWNQLLDTKQLGGEEIFKRRIQTGKLNNGTELTYASGIENWLPDSGFRLYSHSGATAGYRAVLMYYPEKKLSIAILSNDGDFAPVPAGFNICDIFLGRGPEIKSTDEFIPDTRPLVSYDAKALNGFVGEYYSEDAHCTWKVILKDDWIHLIDETLEDILIEPTKDKDTFLADYTLVEFKRNKKGIVNSLAVSVSRAKNVPFTKVTK